MTEYMTPDTPFVAYAIVAGVRLLRMERRDAHSRRVTFVLADDGATIETLRASWIDGTGKVSARQFADTLRSLHASLGALS